MEGDHCMTIRILGLRQKASGTTYTVFARNKWGAPNHAELFNNLDLYLNEIPEFERYNLFYTVNHIRPSRSRDFLYNDIYAFDLDKIDLTKLDEYIDLTLNVLKVSRETTAIICSGNGLHFLIELKDKTRDDPKIFDNERKAYAGICNAINSEMEKHGLPGHADPQIFDKARILRLPGTTNRKKDKEDKECYLIQPNLVAVDYKLTHSLGIEELSESEFINTDSLSSQFPSIDSKAVTSECVLFQTALSDPESITENNWKAMINICTHLEDGLEIAHEYSKGYSGYSREETDAKFNSSTSIGPVLCRTVEQRYQFDKCKSCIHYKSPTVRTPVAIRGENHIATRDTGFRRVKPNGTPGNICYSDLTKFFKQEVGEHVTDKTSGAVWAWINNHWKVYTMLEAKGFCNDIVKPPAKENERVEFFKTIQVMNLRDDNFFGDTSNKINFRNGVLHLDTMELKNHSLDNGFRYILDYDYDPSATCPLFDKFMDDVTQGDKAKEKLLLEYAGYCISDNDPVAHKAMILLGEGSNGKSTFIEVLQFLAGEDNYSSLTLKDLQKDNHRAQLIGKLFNVAEETPMGSMKDSAVFKTLVTGGTSTAKLLYQNSFNFRNKTKFLFAANDMPKTVDTSTGLMRRLIIVPFDASFKGANINRNILKELKQERSGILNRCLNALKDLKANEWEFTQVQSVDDAVEDYQREINDVSSFAEDCMLQDSQFVYIPVNSFYDAYIMWCEESGKRYRHSLADFSKKLRKVFPAARVTRKSFDGVKKTVYTGIGLGKDFKKF